MTPAEFLTARLDEDEAVAKAAVGEPGTGEFSWRDVDYNSAVAQAHGERWRPEHVLADIAAKRAIADLAEEATGLDMQVDGEFRIGRRDEAAEPYVGDLILRRIAQPYAEHPDYDPAWRVS